MKELPMMKWSGRPGFTPLSPRPTSRLRVEELESRDLLSAVVPGSLVAQPAGTAVPLAAAPDVAAAVVPQAGSTSPASVVYSPQQVRQAYGFDQVKLPGGVAADGSGQTIAIVDAFDDPSVVSDLHHFDQTFGLPDPPSFVKLTPQSSAAHPIQEDDTWAGEIALDVEWAHAIAPKANILLVEANSDNYGNLMGAVLTAIRQPGVVAVSMSWGGPEFAAETAYDGNFYTPWSHTGGSGLKGGITFVAASGDSGFGTEWPAVSPDVLAVGGTSLVLSSTNGYQSESAWSGGGGDSTYETEPGFQRGVQSSGARSTPDVAYDADINTGFFVYNTAGLPSGDTGWWAVGGTSAGVPQWAALVAIADQGRALDGLGSLANAQSLIYGLPASAFHDITTGSNGSSAGVGYDLVTGRGSPFADRVVAGLVNPGSNPTPSKSGTASSVTTAQLQHHAEAVPIQRTGSSAAAEAGQSFLPALGQLEPQTSPPADAPPAPVFPPEATGFVQDAAEEAGSARGSHTPRLRTARCSRRISAAWTPLTHSAMSAEARQGRRPRLQ
jgi:subtilase family serine protease